ncbi:putative oxysterol binding protein [Pseudovirgaria hyperparasitica]|uniref:Putative oxysterol binding protein n=1 Tax=Pseudovirgaria hyperparasitica TaxID=470096 RepID=A0A6A6VZZ4_9PEZI|nr:putative oxysterol binding protein [Pseudovirgaria hyperparasitica]KAF2755250.1 putative oxysterol binding protein [Pseudovirgaria hyperparasitica]
MLMHIISQLRPGADLSRITLPTFILEPRSMLERITNFMAHPETLLPMTDIDDPVLRFVSVVKFYLSGWHIKPPGVKKPLNPILGETFTGYWDYPDSTRGYYISEQTSHHPPKSSYFFMAPEHHIRIDGCLKPRSKFLGNSAASMMEGIAVMRFLKTKERFFVTQPNMYARGILFGKMKYELGDHSYVRCPESGLEADIEFKVKGWVGGGYNAIGGYIKDTKSGHNLYELSGMWTGEMFIKDLATGKKEPLFDATHAKETPPLVRPIDEQGDRESQKLWAKVTKAIKEKDQDIATDEKSRIEDMQRKEAAERNSKGVDWKPSLFCDIEKSPEGYNPDEKDLDWIINAKIDGKTPEEQTKQILQIAAIIPGQSPDRKFSIPLHKASISDQPTTNKSEVASDDLIDFGQSEPSATQPATRGIHPKGHAPTSSNVDLLQEPLQPTTNRLRNPGSPTSTASKDSLKRRDSETDDLDEFVDAES